MHVPPVSDVVLRGLSNGRASQRPGLQPGANSKHCRTSPAAIYPIQAAYSSLAMSLLRQTMFQGLHSGGSVTQ